MKLGHRGLLQHKSGYNFELQRQMGRMFVRIFLIAFLFSVHSWNRFHKLWNTLYVL